MVPSEQLPPQPETLQGGPTEPLLGQRAVAWIRRSAVPAAFAVGLVGGGGAAWWWSDRSADEVQPPAAVATEVRLVVVGIVAAAPPDGPDDGGVAPLRIDGVLLHDRGTGSATVTRIHRPGGSLTIRAPALPVTISVNDSYERIRLELHPGECELATRWTPSSQPFTLTWVDDRGVVHEALGGDHDASMEIAMIRYLDAACGRS